MVEATGSGTKVRLDTCPTPARRLGAAAILGLMLLTAIVGGLRFARADLAGTSFFATDEYYKYTTDDGKHLDHLNIDIVSYLAMIEDRRGVDDAFHKMVPYDSYLDSGTEVYAGPVAPFIHRPVIPFVASVLPMDAADAFALVNLLLVVAGLWFMVDALAVQGRSTRAQLIGGLLYALSIPVLVFTSSLFIDGGTMAVFLFGYWLIVRRLWVVLAVFLPLSYAVKETLIFLTPSAVVAWRAAGHSYRDRRFLIGVPLMAVAWIAVAALVRVTAPTPEASFSLGPRMSFVTWNLSNPVSAVFFVVSCSTVMLPAFACIYRFVRSSGWRGTFDRIGPEFVGMATFVLVNVYSIAATDLTARTAWAFWPFGISLSALLADQLKAASVPWHKALSTVI